MSSRWLVLGAFAMGVVLWATQGSLGAQGVPTCDGVPATIVGTEGDDVLRGTEGPDVMVGLGGNDILRGLGGNDLICGDNGRDRLFGGEGNDTIFGGTKNDILKGDQGRDTLFGNQGNDRLRGGGGRDVLDGGSGFRDVLDGRGGFDLCIDPQVSSRVRACEDIQVPLLDTTLPATFGDVALFPGFEPDPFEILIIPGGPVDVGYLGGPCVGLAARAPDLELTYGPGGEYLQFFFEGDIDNDTALVINDPAGDWFCNDDFIGLDPAIELLNPLPGVYDIWVASLDGVVNPPGFLGITEIQF